MREGGLAEVEYHIARLLLLLDTFTRHWRLEGLTKLAKLDFLLRYPAFLDRLLKADGIPWPERTEPSPTERQATESKMVRYKYGPWDTLYYPLVGALVSRGLATHVSGRGRVSLALTEEGRKAARAIAKEPVWQVTAARCRLLRQHYNITGNALKERIYHELPEVVDLPHRSEIT